MDDLIDGTICGWPVSAQIMRNPGEKWVGVQVAPYTDDDDASAPDCVWAKCADLEGDFKTRREVMTHLRRGGFVPKQDA